MDQPIDDYIRENRARYTPKAIREQLIAAGHDPAVVDAAWDRMAGGPVAPAPPIGWRPRWREFLVLTLLGAIGAGLVWANESPYAAGGLVAMIYVILVSAAFGVGKAFSLMVDAGNTVTPIILLALVAIGAVATLNSAWGVALAVVPAAVALLLLYFRKRNPGRARMVGAAIPILVWAVVTGTCYSPILTS